MHYLYHRSFYESLCLLKAHVICYNEATGGPNSATGGFHETLTVFWLKILAGFLETRKCEPLFKLCNDFLENPLSSKETPFQYYTKEKIFSVEARAIYLEQEKSDQ
jgi:hypothetical protein